MRKGGARSTALFKNDQIDATMIAERYPDAYDHNLPSGREGAVMEVERNAGGLRYGATPTRTTIDSSGPTVAPRPGDVEITVPTEAGFETMMSLYVQVIG